jgi:hypothetical protein
MTDAFAFGYLLLWGVVALQGLVLRELLQRTVWLKGLYRESDKHLHTGTPAPEFTAPLLGGTGRLATPDLLGHKSMLLFVSPYEAMLPHYDTLSRAMHAMWHKADGYLYVVCSGSEARCRELTARHRVKGVARAPLLVWDEQGTVAEAFGVTNTPQAVLLDAKARVSHHGRPLLSEQQPEMPIAGGA